MRTRDKVCEAAVYDDGTISFEVGPGALDALARRAERLIGELIENDVIGRLLSDLHKRGASTDAPTSEG